MASSRFKLRLKTSRALRSRTSTTLNPNTAESMVKTINALCSPEQRRGSIVVVFQRSGHQQLHHMRKAT
jgi:hypothetical protein